MKNIQAITWKKDHTIEKEQSIPARLCGCLLGMVFLFGFLLGILQEQPGVEWFVWVLGAVVYALIFWLPKGKPTLIAAVGLALLPLMGVLTARTAVQHSMAAFLNVYLERWSLRWRTIVLTLSDAAPNGIAPAIVCLFSAVWIALCSKERAYGLWIPTLLLAVGMGTGCISGACIPVVMMALICLWITDAGSAWLRLVPVCLCTALLAAALFPAMERFAAAAKNANREISDAYHHFVYDGDAAIFPEGRLDQVPAFTPEGVPALRITMEAPQKLYLRGFVGESYSDDGWEKLPDESLDGAAELFYWLHQRDFYAQTQISNLLLDQEQVKISVENLEACSDTQYLPYALSDSGILDAAAYADAQSAGRERSIQTSFMGGGLADWYSAQIELSLGNGDPAYLAAETAYRQFVKDHYLDIPENVKTLLGQMLRTEGDTLTLPEIQEHIHLFLQENLSYNPYVITNTGDMDFASYTLLSTRSGYSVHYALIAACLLRYYGVPARYVEGYYLSAEKAAEVAPGEEIILTDADSHAWAEFYLNGVGWIPFEATPGYLDDEELALQSLLSDPDSPLHQALQNTYEQQEYEIPQAPVEQPEDIEPPVRRSIKFSWIPLLAAAIAALLAAAGFLYIRNRILRKCLLALETEEPKLAIPALFSYADTLLAACNYDAESGELPLAEATERNREALFSRHEMSDAHRKQMAELCSQADTYCRQHCSWKQRLVYRWVKNIYR